MAEGGSERDRQHPQNMQGLLHMAIEAGSAAQNTNTGYVMTEERRKWLQEAMSSAFQGQVGEVQQMKECLADLQRGIGAGDMEAEDRQEEEERKERALELLADLCENLDNAADFCKLDGMRFLVQHYLERPEATLRQETAHLIGTCSQNVPFVQEHVLSLGAMGKLLRLLDVDSSEAVRIKALFAISCIVREQEAGLLEFLRLDGFSVLMRAMQSDVMKLKVKSAFLLQNLLLSHPEHKVALCSMGMIQQLVDLLRTEHSPFHEHVLGALCSLVMDFPQGISECRAPELGFEDLLKERHKLIEKQDEFQEELEFCDRLLRICFQNRQDDVGMDR